MTEGVHTECVWSQSQCPFSWNRTVENHPWCGELKHKRKWSQGTSQKQYRERQWGDKCLSHCENRREVSESMTFSFIHSISLSWSATWSRNHISYYSSLWQSLPSSPDLSPVIHPIANNNTRAKYGIILSSVICMENKIKRIKLSLHIQ